MRRLHRVLITTTALLFCSLAILLAVNGLPKFPRNSDKKEATPKFARTGELYPQDFSEDDAVLSAVLRKACSNSGQKVVLSSTPADPADDSVERTGLYLEARAAMLRRSPKYFGESEHVQGDSIRLPNNCPGLMLASDAEIDSALSGEIRGPTYQDWGSFKARFPGATAVLRVSLPGYSRDGNYAVVYSSASCGRLCGSGFSITLRRTRDGWVIVDSTTAWIS